MLVLNVRVEINVDDRTSCLCIPHIAYGLPNMFPDIALGPEWEAAWTQKQMPPADKVAKQVVGLGM